MPAFGLPPRLKEKVRKSKRNRGGYGAPPKYVLTYGKAPEAETSLPGVFKLPRVGAAAKAAVPKPVTSPIAPPQAKLGVPSRFIIEGKRASDLEWRVWSALLKLGWPQSEIDFQVDVLGGHMPGGAILDFVVWTPGMVTIIEPSGDYWHTHTSQQQERDRMRVEKIQHAWTRPFKYYSLGSGDLVTDEQAYHLLFLKVGRY